MTLSPITSKSDLTKTTSMNDVLQLCIQNFLFTIKDLLIEEIAFKSNSQNFKKIKIDSEGIYGSFEENSEGALISFDGIFNAFPAGTFSKHTNLSTISLRAELKGEISIQILHVDEEGEHVLHQESFSKHDGPWESPPLLVTGKDGRFYFSCQIHGEFSLYHLGWWTERGSKSLPFFMACITTYRSTKVIGMLHELSAYTPLIDCNISFAVIDNGKTINIEDLPKDDRFILISQPNLGATAGAMRGLIHGRSVNAEYLITIADDDMILHPEILFRMIMFQTLSSKSVAIGAMLIDLENPAYVTEQGARIPDNPYNAMNLINRHVYLADPNSIKSLYRNEECDYTAWWLMSAPCQSLPFLPAFFLYFGDILQCLLLRERQIKTVVPPHLFIWQNMGLNFMSFRGYDWYRNDLAMRLTAGIPIKNIAFIKHYLKKVLWFISVFDYDRAELFIHATVDVLEPQKWSLDPVNGAQQIQRLQQSCSALIDLSSQISNQYVSFKTKNQAQVITRFKQVFSVLTLAGYLNPFVRSVKSDGKLAFRSQGNYDFWEWAGFQQLAVIDEKKIGYICKRSWKKAILILLKTIYILIRFITSKSRLRESYQRSDEEYEKMWLHTFDRSN